MTSINSIIEPYLNEEIERRQLTYIEPFLKKKRGKAKEICKFIIEYLVKHAKYETQGWVIAIELWERCENRGYNPKAITDQLRDMEKDHIIDKIVHRSPATRMRHGVRKTRKNIFYRLTLAHAACWTWSSGEWDEAYHSLLNSFETLANKWNIALILLKDIKTANPDIFKELVVTTKSRICVEIYKKMWESDPEEIIKALLQNFDNSQNAAMEEIRRRGVPTIPELLDKILTERAGKHK